MLLIISRLLIAAYFLFSALNKVFFFRVFSKFLNSFTGFNELIATILASGVIAAEILFALFLIWLSHKWILRGFALVLSVPFIIYNSYIYFVLNVNTCNCAFSSSGESLTHPLFSIFILTLTLLVTFLTTREKDKSIEYFTSQLKAIVTVAAFVVTISINLFIWNQYVSSDLNLFKKLEFSELIAADQGEEEKLDVYIHFTESSPQLFIELFSQTMSESSSAIKFNILSSDKELSQTLPNTFMAENGLFIHSYQADESVAFSHVGIQVYSGSRLLYRRDELPEMTSEVFAELRTSLIKEGLLSACDENSQADVYENLAGFLADSDAGKDQILLLMDRRCRECDADLLALLESFTSEDENISLKKIYFVNDFVEEENSLVMPAAMATRFGDGCFYPNKLLFVKAGDRAPVIINIPPLLAGLEEKIIAVLQ